MLLPVAMVGSHPTKGGVLLDIVPVSALHPIRDELCYEVVPLVSGAPEAPAASPDF